MQINLEDLKNNFEKTKNFFIYVAYIFCEALKSFMLFVVFIFCIGAIIVYSKASEQSVVLVSIIMKLFSIILSILISVSIVALMFSSFKKYTESLIKRKERFQKKQEQLIKFIKGEIKKNARTRRTSKKSR